MSAKQIIQTEKAPKAIGPYSQAVVTHGMVYCSGQIPLDPDSGELITGSIGEQTRRVMDNLEAVLLAAGSSLSNVVKCTIFLSDMGYFSEVNQVYGSYFVANPPARETVAVKTLPKNADVEISCIATI